MTPSTWPLSEKLSQYLTASLPEPPIDVEELRKHIDQKMLDLRNFVVQETNEGVLLINPNTQEIIEMVPAPDWDIPKNPDIVVHPESPRDGMGTQVFE